MNTEAIIFWTWTAFILVHAVIDYNMMPFENHRIRTYIRLVIGTIFWLLLIYPNQDFTIFEKWLVFPAFMVTWFWWVFDTMMGILIAGNPFYVGTVAKLDQKSSNYNLAAIWLVKAALAIVPASYVGNMITGYF